MHSKKHLSFSAIQGMIADKFANAQDTRAPNASNSIKDTMLSGLACMYFQSDSLMYFQSDSLLEFQRTMERRQQRNNLRSMFSVQNLPTDQGIRNVIDEVDTENAFRPIFKDLFNRLQRGKHLEQYQLFLVNIYLT